MAWRDNYSCFPSRAACEGWLGTMRAAWRPVEGYRSCLLVRNGPMQGPPAWIATPYDRDMDRSFE